MKLVFFFLAIVTAFDDYIYQVKGRRLTAEMKFAKYTPTEVNDQAYGSCYSTEYTYYTQFLCAGTDNCENGSVYCIGLSDPRAPVDNTGMILTVTLLPAILAAFCCFGLMLFSYLTCWMVGIGYEEFDTRKKVPKKMSTQKLKRRRSKYQDNQIV